jgi:SpoVK/Ycf46/Vps4 family AAA+-type ATPase
MSAEKPDTLEIVELLLTAEIYNQSEKLNEDDLPPKIRKVYFDPATKGVKRPMRVTLMAAEKISERDNIRRLIKELPFVVYEEIGLQLKLTGFDAGVKWFAGEDSLSLIRANPALAYLYENYDSMNVSYAEARLQNQPFSADRELIDAKLKKLCADKKEADELLKLVTIKAPEDVRDTLDNLVLTEEQREEIAKAGKALEHRQYLKDVGLYEIGKILFVGPPGTGKTSSARALSRWFGLPLVEVKLSMIISHYLGETSKNIDKVFLLAKEVSPCILFIDEFDFVAKTRGSDDHGAIKRAVNTLLKAIDEVSLVEDSVLLIAATNYPQLLDYAAWRRFDKVLGFFRPDAEMRCRILEKVLQRMDATVDPPEIARLTEGYTGSDLRLVVREAVLNALLQDRRKIDQKDLLRAVEQFERRMSAHRQSNNGLSGQGIPLT